MTRVFKIFETVVFAAIWFWFFNVLWHYPYNTAGPVQSSESNNFYESAYSPEDEQRYVAIAEFAAKSEGIEADVKTFVNEHHVQGKRVLDVGTHSFALSGTEAELQALL